jgi:transporter family protein
VVALAIERPAAAWTAADVLWAGAGGVAALCAYVGLFLATEHGRLAIVVPIVSSWAVLSAAIGIVLLGEVARATQLAGAALVVAGVVLVARATAGPDPDEARGASRGALWAALAGALGFGVLIPALSRLAPVTGALGGVVLVFAIDLALGLPVARRRGIALAPPHGGDWGPVALAGLCEVAGFACITLGGSHAPLAVVAPAASVAAPLTVAWAWVVLHERPGALAGCGAALSSLGVLVLSL